MKLTEKARREREAKVAAGDESAKVEYKQHPQAQPQSSKGKGHQGKGVSFFFFFKVFREKLKFFFFFFSMAEKVPQTERVGTTTAPTTLNSIQRAIPARECMARGMERDMPLPPLRMEDIRGLWITRDTIPTKFRGPDGSLLFCFLGILR